MKFLNLLAAQLLFLIPIMHAGNFPDLNNNNTSTKKLSITSYDPLNPHPISRKRKNNNNLGIVPKPKKVNKKEYLNTLKSNITHFKLQKKPKQDMPYIAPKPTKTIKELTSHFKFVAAPKKVDRSTIPLSASTATGEFREMKKKVSKIPQSLIQNFTLNNNKQIAQQHFDLEKLIFIHDPQDFESISKYDFNSFLEFLLKNDNNEKHL